MSTAIEEVVRARLGLRVVLPWPTNVNVNHQYVKTRWGLHLSPEATAWRNTVIVLARQQPHATFPPDAPLGFALYAYCPDKRRHDLDGLIKATLDSLCQAIDVDDARVVYLYARKFLDRAKPCLHVWLGLAEDS